MQAVTRAVIPACVVLFSVMLAVGAPPAKLDYQGKILINDVPFTGAGFFKFAISDQAGTVNFWANDGTAAGEPTHHVTNNCYNGVFNVVLGGPGMLAIDPDIFRVVGTTLVLRVWFSEDGATFNELLPAQEILSAPYAINADQVDGFDAHELIAAATNAFVEKDPIFMAHAASSIDPGDIANWDMAYGWGNHAAAGYATGTPVYVETDPVWTAAQPNYFTIPQSDAAYVNATGDVITGLLVINSPFGLRIHSASNETAVGRNASGANEGTAVGTLAMGDTLGAAVGLQANGSLRGAAIGMLSDGSAQGAAVGRNAIGYTYGAAMGGMSRAEWNGAALGWAANGTNYGVAVGCLAQGANANIAIGFAANARDGMDRVAIGRNVTNDVDNSVRVRGTIYMDGGESLFGRGIFGTGPWRKLLPLLPLDSVVFVATNGSPAGSGAIDRPLDSPQAGYDMAATRYAARPATLVILGGSYASGLNMHAGNVHVVGLDRPELATLTVTHSATGIVGKQRVHNVIVRGVTTVAVDQGRDVKFHNCRFEGGLLIYGSNVEVQDCYARAADSAAVTVGNGSSPVSEIALYQSSFENESAGNGAVTVNQGVNNFAMLYCYLANYANGPCVLDLESGPISPVHLYAHNYLRSGGPGSYALVDPTTGPMGRTIAFLHNVAFGDVGMNGVPQFFANNAVYGIINNTLGLGAPGWSQAGSGLGIDGAGNVEHQTTYPPLPRPWRD